MIIQPNPTHQAASQILPGAFGIRKGLDRLAQPWCEEGNGP